MMLGSVKLKAHKNQSSDILFVQNKSVQCVKSNGSQVDNNNIKEEKKKIGIRKISTIIHNNKTTYNSMIFMVMGK